MISFQHGKPCRAMSWVTHCRAEPYVLQLDEAEHDVMLCRARIRNVIAQCDASFDMVQGYRRQRIAKEWKVSKCYEVDGSLLACEPYWGFACASSVPLSRWAMPRTSPEPKPGGLIFPTVGGLSPKAPNMIPKPEGARRAPCCHEPARRRHGEPPSPHPKQDAQNPKQPTTRKPKPEAENHIRSDPTP